MSCGDTYHISTRAVTLYVIVVHNSPMRYGALLGWGIVIYAVVVLVYTGFALYGLRGTLIAALFQLLALITVTTIAGRSLKFHSWKDILPYSFLWAVIAAFLDIIYNVPFGGWGIYTDWSLWLIYGLIAVVPLLAPTTRVAPEVPEV